MYLGYLIIITCLFEVALSCEQTKSAVGFSPLNSKLRLLYSIREGLLHTEGFIKT